MKLLLVEDSHSLQRSLSAGLTNSGYTVDQAFDGEQADSHLRNSDYDVVVLDLMIPKIDGLTLLEKLRKRKDNTYVLILSARDRTEDRIKGLDIGADDYLVKPFAFDELLSRLRAVTRRSRTGNQPMNSSMMIGALSINTADRTVIFEESAIVLTPSEYVLLELLARRRGQVFSHDQLMDRLHDAEHVVTRNAVEAHVSALRKKLRSAGVPPLIETRRGFGYYIKSKAD